MKDQVRLTLVRTDQSTGVMMRNPFLAGNIDERVGSCGFELDFEECISKDYAERDK